MNPIFVLLMILLAALLIAAAAIFVIAARNIAAMNRCTDTILTELRSHYTLTPMDPGEYKQLTVYHLIRFQVEQYNIEELGNLSVMRVNMGAMQMANGMIDRGGVCTDIFKKQLGTDATRRFFDRVLFGTATT